MALRFSTRKTQRFYYQLDGEDESYVLIYGDEIDIRDGASFKGPDYAKAVYRGREGAVRKYSIGGEKSPMWALNGRWRCISWT